MSEIYVISPAHVATGGTELLQQLCKALRDFQLKSSMVYTEEFKNSPVSEKFKMYNNPIAREVVDIEDNVVVIPETRVEYARKYKKAKIIIWWLSVDNYSGSGKVQYDFLHTIVYKYRDWKNSKIFGTCQHLVQSEYARLYLINEKKIDENQIFYLSDYLNKAYLSDLNIQNYKKENNILYNPKKGFEFTKQLKEAVPEYNWIPLQGYTPDEMKEIMKRSKVYIDFGNHPGKDRIPREAAICGCCVITGKSGAAKNQIDIPINSKYKFDESIENIDSIHKMIDECMNHFEENTRKFEEYRKIIMSEEERFKNDVAKIFVK